jgi:hypothetical protein
VPNLLVWWRETFSKRITNYFRNQRRAPNTRLDISDSHFDGRLKHRVTIHSTQTLARKNQKVNASAHVKGARTGGNGCK